MSYNTVDRYLHYLEHSPPRPYTPYEYPQPNEACKRMSDMYFKRIKSSIHNSKDCTIDVELIFRLLDNILNKLFPKAIKSEDLPKLEEFRNCLAYNVTKLQELRDNTDYYKYRNQYSDLTKYIKDTLPEYENKLNSYTHMINKYNRKVINKVPIIWGNGKLARKQSKKSIKKSIKKSTKKQSKKLIKIPTKKQSKKAN